MISPKIQFFCLSGPKGRKNSKKKAIIAKSITLARSVQAGFRAKEI
jgi:hypothetical protein